MKAPGTVRLAPCPKRPNCVSSQAPAGPRYVKPFWLAGDAEAGWRAVREVMASWPRCELVAEREGWARYAVRTAVLGFVDDVELALDREARVVHVRSAARVGWWDLGVNRRRVEELRRRLVRGEVVVARR